MPQVDGMTALHWAAWHDDDRDGLAADPMRSHVTARNRYDVTPLSLACTNGNVVIVRRLLRCRCGGQQHRFPAAKPP